MKKILLFIMASLMLMALAGCSEETTEVIAEDAFNERIASSNVNDLTIEEALYLTVQDLYNVPELSETAKNNIWRIFQGVQNSASLVGAEGYDNLSLPGVGTIEYPAIASVLFQMLYNEFRPEDTDDTTDVSGTLQSLLTYSVIDNETLFEEVVTNLAYSFVYSMLGYSDLGADADILSDFLDMFGTYIMTSQDDIVAVMQEYTSLLSDSSSSASKTTGGGGVVSFNEYLVSANAAYTMAELLIRADVVVDFDATVQPEKVEFLAKTLYDAKDETKLKVTYDKHLAYFDITDAIDTIENETVVAMLSDILSDANETEETPGGAPYPASWVIVSDNTTIVLDDELNEDHGYIVATDEDGNTTADIRIYQKIGNYLLGSPAGNDIYLGADYGQLEATNRVKNNMLNIYQQLKQLGLKAPLYTTEIGSNTLAELIAYHLKSSGVIYLYANAYNAEDFTTDLLSDLTRFDSKYYLYSYYFFEDQGNGIPACDLIAEYNLAIEEASIGRPSNIGYYTQDADGGPCGIVITEEERRNFDETDYGVTAE